MNETFIRKWETRLIPMAKSPTYPNELRETYSISEKNIIESDDGDSLTITGLALPFGERSRNKVAYRKKSVEKTHKQLKGKPVLFNHHEEDLPCGKITDTQVSEKGLHYTFSLNPDYKVGNNLLKKAVERGDLNKVSVSITPIEETAEKDGNNLDVDVQHWNEISLVTIPGFEQTNVKLVQKFRESLNSKKSKGDDKMSDKDKEYVTKQQFSHNMTSIKDSLQTISELLKNLSSSVYADSEDGKININRETQRKVSKMEREFSKSLETIHSVLENVVKNNKEILEKMDKESVQEGDKVKKKKPEDEEDEDEEGDEDEDDEEDEEEIKVNKKTVHSQSTNHKENIDPKRLKIPNKY